MSHDHNPCDASSLLRLASSSFALAQYQILGMIRVLWQEALVDLRLDFFRFVVKTIEEI